MSLGRDQPPVTHPGGDKAGGQVVRQGLPGPRPRSVELRAERMPPHTCSDQG